VSNSSEVQPLDGRPDWVVVDLVSPDVSEGVSALAGAEVPLLAFELEGARLSDAFLSMTEED
jgi:hypothetical protein